VEFPPAPRFPSDHQYTLDELIQLSVHRNAGLDVARHEAEAAQGLVDQVKALWLPSVRYDFAATAYDNDLNYKVRALHLATINVPLTGSFNIINSLNLSQIVATGGKRTSGLKQAKMYAAIKRLDVLRQQDAVAQDVTTYYQLVCLTSAIDAVLDDTVRRIRVFRQVAENLNQRGSLRASDLDYLQADYFVSQLDQFRLALQTGRHQAYTALKQTVGVGRDEQMLLKSVELPPAVTMPELVSAYASIVKGLLGRPETHEVDLFARLRAEQVNFAKAQYAPNVAFTFEAINTQGAHNTILNALDGLIAGFIVDVPIYDPARRGKLREALGLEQAALAFQRQVEELITLEIEVTAVECQRALVTVFQAERAERVAAAHYDAARQAYSRELVPASAVVTAIAFDMLAKIQHLQAVFAYENARAKLNRVTAEREAPYGH
jgi:outer membrane protein TolC